MTHKTSKIQYFFDILFIFFLVLTPAVMRLNNLAWTETIFFTPILWCVFVVLKSLPSVFNILDGGQGGEQMMGMGHAAVIMALICGLSIAGYLVSKLAQFIFF